MNSINQIIFLFLIVLLALLSTYILRRVVQVVDNRTDYLAAKFINEQPPAWSVLVIPVRVILILSVLALVTICVGLGIPALVRLFLMQKGSQFVVISYEAMSIIGGVAIGIVIATMVIPLGFMKFASERLQWIFYFRLQYASGSKASPMFSAWLRTALSAIYLTGAIALPWISVSDYVRVNDSEVCRHQFIEINESCKEFREIEKIEFKQEIAGGGRSYYVLNIYDNNQVWASIQSGADASAQNIGNIWVFLKNQPEIKVAEMP